MKVSIKNGKEISHSCAWCFNDYIVWMIMPFLGILFVIFRFRCPYRLWPNQSGDTSPRHPGHWTLKPKEAHHLRRCCPTFNVDKCNYYASTVGHFCSRGKNDPSKTLKTYMIVQEKESNLIVFSISCRCGMMHKVEIATILFLPVFPTVLSSGLFVSQIQRRMYTILKSRGHRHRSGNGKSRVPYNV